MTSETSLAEQPRAAAAKISLVIPLVVACGLFMENLDSTVINTAIPTIARALGENPLRLNLAVTSYLLSLAVFIPISGWVADRYGTRNVFCGAIAVFTLGSGLCGMSRNLTELVATRILQGLGGAMMTPVGRLILVRSFPKSRLVQAMTYVTIPALIGPAIGPVLGGFMTTYASWRWIFYVNLPIGIVGCYYAWKVIENYKAPALPRFDLAGFIVVGVALATFQLGLESIGRHVISWPSQLGVFVLSALCFAVYGVHARHVRFPAINLTPFSIRTFRIAVLFGGSIRIPMGAVPFLTPLFLQVGLGYTALESGLHTFLLAVGALLVKTVAPRLLRFFGFKRLLVGNSIIVGVTIGGMAMFGASSPSLLIAAFLLLSGFFRSIQFTSVNTLGYADLNSEMMSKATSISSVGQQLTMSIGVALSSTLLLLLGGDHPLSIDDFRIVFLINGALAVLTMFAYRGLLEADGAEISGHLVAVPSAVAPKSR